MAQEETKSSTTAAPIPTATPAPSVPPVPTLNVFGRPREYDPIRTIERVKAYLESPRAVDGKLKIPSVEGLAVYLKCARSTIYKWAEEFPDFSDILEDLMAQQAAMLVENGLDGTYNSTITKLMMTKHGYKDQSDLTTNNKDITPDNQALADAAIDKYFADKNKTKDVTPGNSKEPQTGANPAAN